MNTPELDQTKQRRYVSALISNAKDFLTALFQSVLQVKVVNPDTNLLKETAENTRKTSSRLKELVEKEVPDTKIDLAPLLDAVNSLAVTLKPSDEIKVTNLSDIKTPTLEKTDISPLLKEFKDLNNRYEVVKEIKITNLADIKLETPQKIDISTLEKALAGLKTALSAIYDYLPRLKPQDFPKITFPKDISVKEADKIIKTIEKGTSTLSDDLVGLSEVIKNQEGFNGEVTLGKVEVTNFPPQHIPTPVTNININSLRGVPKSSVLTVSTQPTALPATALEQRRSLIIYNNSSNMIYLGGADVTISNGMPIPASSYSPPIDAGQYMIVYAIAGSTSEVRCLEVSSDAEGN